ncbi:hypothetical protein DYBT9623_04584 [Dyadobacter sp. CECT 9623]|uniref:Lipocalin-like domain-containing protein n=2 Tax=Spirosomataceae TaxID=2896860 RepID=A0ABN7RCU2_9BACT|nr:hypothetical protein DYBT9623_04584 [Dyadobacter sp. CECT 9623]
MGACKDKKENVEPETDFAPDFAGVYATTTVIPPSRTDFNWVVTQNAKNQLNIVFTKDTEVSAAGSTISLLQTYKLINVKTTSKDMIELDETVDVEQSNGKQLRQKVQGTGTRVINKDGIPQINITLKLTDASTNNAIEEYLEFKKK